MGWGVLALFYKNNKKGLIKCELSHFIIFMEFVNGPSHLKFDDRCGGLIAFSQNDNALIARAEEDARPLFVLAFRDQKGNRTEVSSGECGLPTFQAQSDRLEIAFDAWPELRVKAVASVAFTAEGETEWRLNLEHDREGYLEWVEFPYVVVPGDLLGDGGEGAVFWPVVEGVLVEDLAKREKSHLPYQAIEYPNSGWCGYYPGAASMQMLAYQNAHKVLYFGSHDPKHTTKEIEYCRHPDGVRLIQKVYASAAPRGQWQMAYPVVLAVLAGDWQDAVLRYRTWLEAEQIIQAPKITDRSDFPDWLEESPLVVSYPVTGTGHHSGPTQPNEFFPLVNALPVLDRLSENTHSQLLVLLMHWEGTAPWAPPYMWPPLGGEEGLRAFVDALHQRGHKVGLYCSGAAWTNTADTGPGNYDRTEEFERDQLIRHMCQGPDGEYSCKICNGEGIRYGYDMCVSTDFARDVITSEALKMAAAGVDYIQLLDQNLGGAAYQCHDTRHGHPAGPGEWQTVAMRSLLAHVRAKLAEAGAGHIILGCEVAAADPYLDELPVNDLRFHMGFNWGRPVPAYNLAFHEYACNFMGNQVEALVTIDQVESPWNLFFRMAYSFAAGDLLSAILKDKDEIHWAWCVQWEVAAPPQAPHLAFMDHLNAWRRLAGRSFLYGGRAMPSYGIEGAEQVELAIRWGHPLKLSAVIGSRWLSTEGKQGQFLVNFLPSPQRVQIHGLPDGQYTCHLQPDGSDAQVLNTSNGTLTLNLAPLSAALIAL